MKKLIFLWCVCLSAAVNSLAQTETPADACWVFGEGGILNVFFTSRVDSIIFSHRIEAADSIATQIVYTRDSIYHIPLAAIDSIVFNTGDAPMGVTGTNPIVIPQEPACAMVNITGTDKLPESKMTPDTKAWMEVWDMRDVYFKKRVLLKLNGDASTAFEKKNFAADFCEDEWEGDETTDIKIGDWVTQDGFHFKAYHTSVTKGECPMAYRLFERFQQTKPVNRRAPFMDYYTDDDIAEILEGSDEEAKEKLTDAKCHPAGFPCMVFLNGKFYGIYSWQLKKHRANYNLGRNKTDNIHINGYLNAQNLWGGNINWRYVEVRNPKPKKSKWNLLCQDGTLYDKDLPKELMGEDSPFFDSSSTSCVNTAQTKARIEALGRYMGEIAEYETAYKNAGDQQEKTASLAVLKTEIEKRFSMEWMTDYLLLQEVIQNHDSYNKNWQWTTWGEIDGTVKWYVNPYDLDNAWGILATTAFRIDDPVVSNVGRWSNTPLVYVWNYFLDELKERYRQLRREGVISYETIYGDLLEWTQRIGADNYEREAERWPEMPCDRDNAISDKWELTGKQYITYHDNNCWTASQSFSKGEYTRHENRCYQSLQDNNTGHVPDDSLSTDWWTDVSVKPGKYKAGEQVFDGWDNFYQFRALADVEVTVDDGSADGEADVSSSDSPKSPSRQDHLQGAPFTGFYSHYPYEGGVHHSMAMMGEWIKKKISIMDANWGYAP